MSELKNVVKDVRTGALPVIEIPRFLVWLVAKSFWFWILLVVVGLLVSLAFRG
jgi:hypothetical protein